MNKRAIFVTVQFLFLAAGLLAAGSLSAQQLTAGAKKELKKKEDTLKTLSVQMVMAEEPGSRFRSDSLFVRTLVRALVTPNSFYYPFDSLNISKLYAPDSSFRIFTWQLKKDEYVLLQKGAIQMRTANGKLKLFPLFDNSMYTRNPLDSVRTKNNWIGAIYYRIIEKEYNGKKYYTLLGFDDYSISSNKKWMEVLHFENGEPVFGGPFISFAKDSVKKATQYRYSIEYKKEAKAFFNYDPEMDMIIVDHLISETDEPDKKSTYISDGDYEAFKWENGKWVHVNKLFSQMQRDGDFPKDAMILDDKGNTDEKKLEEASQKTMEKERAKQQPKKKSP